MLTVVQLAKWKESPTEHLPGKALLLYQKFIKPQSLLDMEIEPELRADIEEVLLDEEKLVNAQMDRTFFSNIENYARERLEKPLREFKHTPEYTRVLGTLLQANRLYSGMKQVGIVN
jgi:hypothetical protein